MNEDSATIDHGHASPLNAIQNGWEFFTSPDKYFQRLALRPHWLTPLLAVSVGTILLAWRMAPYTSRAMRFRLLEMMGPEAAKRPELFNGPGIWTTLASPLPLLVLCLLQAALLLLIANLMTGQGTFRHMFSLAAHTSVYSLAGGAYMYLVLALRGLESIQSSADFRVPLGLNVIWPDLGPGLDALLNAINPLQALTMFVLAIGLRRICQCSKGQAAAAALTYFLVTLGCQIAMAVLSNAMSPVPKG